MEPYRNYGRMQCRPTQQKAYIPTNMSPVPKMPKASLAMAYVQMQEWEDLYNPDDALCNGTAFPGLNLIFCGVRGKM